MTIAADVSQDPDASSVATFLNQYFTAINNHDYQSYISLLSSQDGQGLTQEQFDNGFGSTVDSAETLLGTSTAANGDLVASVTFTSHQNPADSPDQQESCTDWNISLFLEQGGGGYLSINRRRVITPPTRPVRDACDRDQASEGFRSRGRNQWLNLNVIIAGFR